MLPLPLPSCSCSWDREQGYSPAPNHSRAHRTRLQHPAETARGLGTEKAKASQRSLEHDSRSDSVALGTALSWLVPSSVTNPNGVDLVCVLPALQWCQSIEVRFRTPNLGDSKCRNPHLRESVSSQGQKQSHLGDIPLLGRNALPWSAVLGGEEPYMSS